MLPPNFHVVSTARIGCGRDMASLPPVSIDDSEFSEEVARTNNEMVRVYNAIENKFQVDVILAFARSTTSVYVPMVTATA